jgi:hypothetical protein
MRPLLLEDLLPFDEYAARRREFFDTHLRYLDRQRRIRIGPSLTLIFENRQTLWFRVQEIVRIARLSDPRHVQRELDLFNRLLPGPDRLHAALLIEMDEGRLVEEMARWQTLRGDELRLRLGNASVPADLLTCRPEDRCSGSAYWVQFTLSHEHRRHLIDPNQEVRFETTTSHYQHDSKPIVEEVRGSLYEDLEMSDRDGALAA